MATGKNSLHRLSALACAIALILSVLPGLCGSRVHAQAGDGAVYLPLAVADFDAAWQWGAPTTPGLTPAPGNIAMTIDASGRPHLFWDARYPYNPQFIYHSYLTANGWSSPATVAPSLGASSLAYRPLASSDGRVHLAWQNETTADEPRRVLYAAFDGNAWSAEEEIYRGGTSGFLNVVLHEAPGGAVYATVVVNDQTILRIVRTEAGWITERQIPTVFQPFEIDWHWIRPDRHGGVHFYKDEFNAERFQYSYWQGDGFVVRYRTVEGKLFGSFNGWPSLLDGGNNLHVCYRDEVAVPGGTVQGVYHKCLDTGLKLTEPAVPSGQQPVAAYAWAVDNVDRFALAWRESNPYGIRLAIWQGCTQRMTRSVALPTGATWELAGLAISATPGRTCLLFSTGGYPAGYRVVCTA